MTQTDGTADPHANWMRDLFGNIESKRLSEICIPATHDSGAYDLQPTKAGGEVGSNWANTQSRSIAAQLLAGVRALDLRFLYTGSPQATPPSLDDIVITHASDESYPAFTTFVGKKAADELRAISDFLSSHSREIVIVFIQQTLRFNDAVHAVLATEINERFGARAISPAERSSTIGTLLANAAAGRIVLTYSDAPKDILQKYPYLWTSGWDNLWLDTTEIGELFRGNNEFLTRKAPNRSTQFDLYTAGLAFTPKSQNVQDEILSRPWVASLLGFLPALVVLPFPWGIVLGTVGAVVGASVGAGVHANRIQSTQQLAQIANVLSYTWIEFLWARKINLFSVDYFEEGGDVMPVVLRINRGECRVPPPANAIESGMALTMYSQNGRFIGPMDNATQYYPKLDPERRVALQLVKAGGGQIRSGDDVAIQSNEPGLEWGGRCYNRLGAWSTPALYYYYDYPEVAANETWTIIKVDPSDDVVHYNDLVVFKNKAYADQVLVPSTDQPWLSTVKIDVPVFWWLQAPPA